MGDISNIVGAVPRLRLLILKVFAHEGGCGRFAFTPILPMTSPCFGGKSVREIASDFYVHPATIYRLARIQRLEWAN
jgi:hypothetical protein